MDADLPNLDFVGCVDAQSELPNLDVGHSHQFMAFADELPRLPEGENEPHVCRSQPLAASIDEELPHLSEEGYGSRDVDSTYPTNFDQPLRAFADELPHGTDNLFGHDLPQLPQCQIPQHLENPDNGRGSTKRRRNGHHASMLGNAQLIEPDAISHGLDNGSLPDIPAFETPAVGGEQAGRAVGRRHLKRVHKAAKAVLRLASKSVPWRSLPYLRLTALNDVNTIAEIFGSDLLGLSPPADWLDVGEAYRVLNNLQNKQWWNKLGKQAVLQKFSLEDQPLAVFLMEIFSGCGNLTYSAALQGMPVAPSIDCRPGQGHADSFVLNLHKASDRRIVWALIVLCSPQWIHLGFPCTFWVAISHWTRIRDLDANEQLRLEALAFISFARQCVHYQASRWRHATLENPTGSIAWKLDMVQDMIASAGMRKVQTDLCAWGSKDPCSGKYYHKSMTLAGTFNMAPLAHQCPRNHEHEVIKGTIPAGPLKGRHRSALSGQYPLPLCKAWVACAKSEFGG